MGKGRVSTEEQELRLSETARLLIRLRSYTDVESALARKFGVDHRTARKWIRKVKAEWRRTAVVDTEEEARGELVAILDGVIASAQQHVVVVKDKDGNPILDQNPNLPDGKPNPGYLKPLVRAEPRVQHILHAVSQLRALRGADRPAKAKIELDGDLNALPEIEALPKAVAEELRKKLEAVAPDGDLRKLAGEWFRQTGGAE